MVQVNGKVLVISLAYNMYMAGAVLCGNAHAIQVNASRQHLAVIVVRMVSADFRASR